MRNLIWIAFLVIAISSSLALAASFEDSIKDANRLFTDAASRHDAVAIAALYHVDARVLPPNGDVVKGREAIEAFWRNELSPTVMAIRVETEDTEKEDDLGVETGTYEIIGQQDATLDKGKYVVVWKKHHDKWYLYRDIWNSSLPAPGVPLNP